MLHSSNLRSSLLGPNTTTDTNKENITPLIAAKKIHSSSTTQPLKKKIAHQPSEAPLKSAKQKFDVSQQQNKRTFSEALKSTSNTQRNHVHNTINLSTRSTNSPSKKHMKFSVFDDSIQSLTSFKQTKPQQQQQQQFESSKPQQPFRAQSTCVVDSAVHIDLVDEETIIAPYEQQIKKLQEEIQILQNDRSYYQLLYRTLATQSEQDSNHPSRPLNQTTQDNQPSDSELSLRKQVSSLTKTASLLRKRISMLTMEKQALQEEMQLHREGEKVLRELVQQESEKQLTQLSFEIECLHQERKDMIKKHEMEVKQLEEIGRTNQRTI
ncbi:hypothetical protein C9374_008631 [Naegleria lovaniensis]|uniref:Uncharacterized protein n=1 Tax=Naegleria lovaniensis TaxID=51637 RepID=A0AA88GEQ4_NAELO|nr:uncharacterized protein C9374_008631 [Naegleria lovaniensis]KAG2378009.1 hypothetical protein C9374_008631 [Naegleria lovaniensis]